MLNKMTQAQYAEVELTIMKVLSHFHAMTLESLQTSIVGHRSVENNLSQTFTKPFSTISNQTLDKNFIAALYTSYDYSYTTVLDVSVFDRYFDTD